MPRIVVLFQELTDNQGFNNPEDVPQNCSRMQGFLKAP